MDKKVKWMPQTYEDLESIGEYIGKDSEYYASSFVQRIIDAGESLSSLYYRGRVVPEKHKDNVREIFVNEYRVIYEITEHEIRILAIIHGRRDLRTLLKKRKI